jgi:hypothetical protein
LNDFANYDTASKNVVFKGRNKAPNAARIRPHYRLLCNLQAQTGCGLL